MRLSDLGEFGLIDLLTRDFTYGAGVIAGVGDDAAVLDMGGGKWLLLTTDMMVEDIHFSLNYSTMRQVGWKLLAVNISDIAAMGGLPAHALISVAAPPHLPAADLVALYRGLREAAGVYGVNLVGGDTVRSHTCLVLNLALLGTVEAGKAVYRKGARPGDDIYVTGTLGAAAAGLHLLQHPSLACAPQAADYCQQAHTVPRPRLAASRFLARYGVTAMDDISDGLASEIHEICRSGGVGGLLRASDVPIDPRVREAAALAGIDPLTWALFGGEDFELVFTATPEDAEKLQRDAGAAGFEIYRVGVITAASEIMLEKADGTVVPLLRGGFDHFSRY